MEAKDIVNILRNEKDLSEAEANERAHAMLATVKGRHPRLEITALVIEGTLTIVCLANGTQAKFDPSLLVPIWKYPEGKRTAHPKSFDRSVWNLMAKAIDLNDDSKNASSKEARQKAGKELAVIFKRWGVNSLDELETTLEKSIGR